MKSIQYLWRQRATLLPSAFNRCLGPGNGGCVRDTVAPLDEQGSYKGSYTAFAVLSGVGLLEQETPQTFDAAMKSRSCREWKAATDAEIQGCLEQQVWRLVERTSLPPNTNVIPVKWVFKIKTDENGAIAKYKARITPKGFRQKHGVDFFEVFANTGKYKSLRVLLSLAARFDMELRQLDVPQAFTQADLDETVYMEMPEGYTVPGMVCLLRKSLYGLKQAPRNWYLLVSAFIKEQLGFTACISDPCIFFKRSKTGRLIVLFLFVDDMQVAFDKVDANEYEQLHTALKARFNITNLGESKFMLGMRITRDRRARTIQLDQELYITKALEKFGLQNCGRTERAPAVRDDTSASKGGSVAGEPADLKLFQEKVGTLLYAAISTRPDIMFAVNLLAQRMQSPTTADAAACDRVFRFLASTKDHGLLFGREASEGLRVSVYADADWGSDRYDRKSITGWVAMLGGDPVSWASKKQKVVAQSTCEAELYAEAAAINEAKWLAGLMQELGLSTTDVPLIYGDSQSAQALTRNDIKSERTKHVDIKYHYVHDEVAHGRVQLKWIPTTEQVADILTKALAGPAHKVMREQLLTRVKERRS